VKNGRASFRLGAWYCLGCLPAESRLREEETRLSPESKRFFLWEFWGIWI